MLAKSVSILTVSLFALACSGTDAPGPPTAAQGDQRHFVPDSVSVSEHVGNNSVFAVTDFTLLQGSSGLEFYAAIRNAGEIVTCNTSFSIELRDQNDEVVAAGVSGLMAKRFYRFGENAGPVAGELAGCVAPGDVTKVAIQSLSLDPANAEVKSVVFSTNSWGNLDLVEIAGVSLTGVSAVTQANGVAYKGSLVNKLDTTLSNPTVAVYPVNAVGRPLGVAYGGSAVEVSPGGNWAFETSTVADPGVSFDAYPMGGP
jgi:hypothetical protein